MPRRDGGYSDLSELKNQAAAASTAPVAQTPAPTTTAPEPTANTQPSGFSIGVQGGGAGGLLVGLVALGIGAAVDALSDKKAPPVAKAKLPTP